MVSESSDAAPRAPLWLLAITIAFPTLLTWLYFVALADAASTGQQAVYSTGKIVQFGLPLLWFVLVVGNLPRRRWPRLRDIVAGALVGGLVAAIGLAAVYGWLIPSGILEPAMAAGAERARSFGVGTPAAFVGLGVFYSLIHAFLEEAYWRGFVFAQLARRLTSTTLAVIVASLAFAAHHVVVLAVFFGVASPWTWLFSAAVALGGVIWATQYRRSGSLWGPWLGHALVDAAIFAVGYDALF